MEANIAKTKASCAKRRKGAQVILPSELFQGPTSTTQEEKWFETAKRERASRPCVAMAPLAKELSVVIPVSIFERDGPRYYNRGDRRCGRRASRHYRKSHIPDGPGYQEKYYFRPGDTGFKVWDTRTAASASASAGTSGIRKARAPWR